ncbi:hypothetical protein B0J18DRAFT_481951 [Chaetomium sp. MPI-SDFR-AT-0129]|nr:hypothetical protein B0J18DRAFT_481951 [Chaetomium sp. MPI-SDFR-AT-0129]
MCIKLKRRFLCAPGVYHTCEYLIKCSNPSFNIDHLISGTIANDNLPLCFQEENLEFREEWYYTPTDPGHGDDNRERCPDCTGEGDVPLREPVKVGTNPQGSQEPDDDGPMATKRRRVYFEFCRTAKSGGDFAMEYCNSLLIWLYTRMFSRLSSLCEALPDAAIVPTGWDDDDEELQLLEMADDMVYLFNELVCRATAFHPSPSRLLPRDDYPLDEQGGEDDGLGFAFPSSGCSCRLTKKPFLNNWASHIRRKLANEAFAALMADGNGGLAQDLRPALRHQEIVFARQKALQAAVERDERFKAVTSLPVLEIIRPSMSSRAFRNYTLTRDCDALLNRCRSEGKTRAPNGLYNHPLEQTARGELLTWARLILVHDIGISLSRARDILAVFGGLVVRFDPRPSPYSQESPLPAPDPVDFARCINETVNEHPTAVTEWVRETTKPFIEARDFEHPFADAATSYIHHEVYRYWLIRDNHKEATEAEFDALRRAGDDTCPICFETFDEHPPSTQYSSRPWQNLVCYEKGRGHWCGAVCLLKFGRAISDDVTAFAPNSVAEGPPPRCPLCREEFLGSDESSDEAAERDIAGAGNQDVVMGGYGGDADNAGPEDVDVGDPMEISDGD